MSHINKVRIKRTIIEPAPVETISPFLGVGVRELARKTNLDASYLSRVKNGKIPVTPERYRVLVRAADEITNTKGENGSE